MFHLLHMVLPTSMWMVRIAVHVSICTLLFETRLFLLLANDLIKHLWLLLLSYYVLPRINLSNVILQLIYFLLDKCQSVV
mgnify:CR=1 FL=1